MTNENITPTTTPTSTMTVAKPSPVMTVFRIRFKDGVSPDKVETFGKEFVLNLTPSADGIWEAGELALLANEANDELRMLNMDPLVQKAWIRQD